MSLVSFPSFGEQTTQIGWGENTCEQLLKEVHKDNSFMGFVVHSKPSRRWSYVYGWVLGYISAMNISTGKTIERNTDFFGIMLSVAKGCSVNPKSKVSVELDRIYKNKIK